MKYLDEILVKAEGEFERFVDEETSRRFQSDNQKEREERFFAEELFDCQLLFKERFYEYRAKRAEKILANA